MNSAIKRFHVEVCGQIIELHLTDDGLILDGQEVEWTCEYLSSGRLSLIVNGQSHLVHVHPQEGGHATITIDGQTLETHVQDERTRLLNQFGFERTVSDAARNLLAPMPGLVLAVLVQPGDEVTAGQGLLVLEAMKMENELRAKTGARIKAIHVNEGEAVSRKALLMEFE